MPLPWQAASRKLICKCKVFQAPKRQVARSRGSMPPKRKYTKRLARPFGRRNANWKFATICN